MKPKYLVLLLLSYVVLFCLLFPGYRYSIDPDATGYLKVAERVSKGDYFNSINGLWSPLGSWLLAPFISMGLDPILSVKSLNGVYGFIMLLAFLLLIKKNLLPEKIAFGISVAGMFLILQIVFLRLFGDLLQALFILLYLNVVCSRNFYSSYKKIILAAFLCGIGFYAKAYTFYFAIANLVIVIIVCEKRYNNSYFSKIAFKKMLAAVLVLITSVVPWAFVLKYKYGSFMLSRTGAYNMTWSLSKAYVQPRILFYAPPYSDGYSLWDDLSYVQVTNLTPFTNSKTFLLQLKLILNNAVEILSNFNIYSCFFTTIIFITLLLILKRSNVFYAETKNLILMSFIAVWPLGLLLLHVETRFLWVMAMVTLLLAGILLTCINKMNFLNKSFLDFISLMIVTSFCIFPVMDLKHGLGSGKDVYEMAAVLKKNKITGNIISYHQNSNEWSACVVLNYLLKGKYFGPFETNYSADEILNGIEKYKIDNYLLFYHSDYQKNELLHGAIASKASSVMGDLYPGIIVLSFKHQ